MAILEDRGDLVVRRNPFDLDGAAVRFTRNPRGGYDPARLSIPLDEPGTPLGLGDDDARSVELPFAFPFYGKNYTRAFVHSDGQLSFGSADTASTQRSLARFLSGPPRIGPFFADLDPARGGSVTLRIGPDRVAVVWSRVPGAAQLNANNFEVALLPSGDVEMIWGAMESREAIVGVSPGDAVEALPADLSAAGPVGATGALVERFSETEHADVVAIARRFLAGHSDHFDQLVIYTTRPLNPVAGSLAFELNVKNEVQGIGLDSFDATPDWGSAGKLRSVVFMDSIDTFLDVDGFEFLGHEVGHRWLANLRFRDAGGTSSTALLGRGLAHWSFFFDSDASVLEGNDLRDVGGGHFESVEIALGYSPLDQYAMGLRSAAEVPPFFYVADPDNFQPSRAYQASSSPEVGVSFTGARREVRIEDVIAAMGPRIPDAAAAPRVLRLAFILMADATSSATEARKGALARIRSRFETYFHAATDGRAWVDATLP